MTFANVWIGVALGYGIFTIIIGLGGAAFYLAAFHGFPFEWNGKPIPWRKVLIEALGWFGLIAVLAAYALISAGAFTAADPAYHLVNLAGAGALAVTVWRKRTWPLVVLNLVWAAVSIASLAGILL